MIIVDLDANEEQEVVVEMEEHRISGVEEDEETSGVDELKDEGSSRLNYGKMSSWGEGVEDAEEDEVSSGRTEIMWIMW